MNGCYYAITRTTPKTTLKHWKYTKREKVNGGWKYYYDNAEDNAKALRDRQSEYVELERTNRELADEYGAEWDRAQKKLNEYVESAQYLTKKDQIDEKLRTAVAQYDNGVITEREFLDKTSDVNEMHKKYYQEKQIYEELKSERDAAREQAMHYEKLADEWLKEIETLNRPLKEFETAAANKDKIYELLRKGINARR